MNKRFSVNPEFFGGIIKDKICKENYSIDKLTYDLINFLSGNISPQVFLEKNSEDFREVLELLFELKQIGVLDLNAEIKEAKINSNKLSAPLRIFYDITYGCNLRCKHCFSNSGNNNAQELTLDEKNMLIRQMKELGTSRISIAGGEPFFCKDFFPFIEECRKSNIEVSVSTNGLCLNEEIVKKLNSLELKTITVSVDGGCEESNDAVRGKGSFKKVINGLNVLKNFCSLNYCIKMTIMRTNMGDIEKIIKLGIKSGCKSVKFNCVREDGRAHENKELVVLSREEYINVLKEIESLKKKYKGEIKIKAPLNIYCPDEYMYIEELGFGCFAGKESICIDALGNVRACSHFPKEYIAGNIRENSLLEIWNNSSQLNLFRDLEGNIDCNSCKVYDKCRGGCRYRAYLNGDINGKDPYCFIN